MSIMISEEEVLIQMANMMEELSLSHEPYLWELGHYLADNLLMKIGLYVIEMRENQKQQKSFFEPVYNKLR